MTQRSGNRPAGKSQPAAKADPSSRANRPNSPAKPIRRRINPRAALGLGILSLAIGGGIFAVSVARSSRGDAGLLVEARKQIKNKKPETALNYLAAYLERRPNDLDALDLRAGILADVAFDGGQVLDAATAYDLLVRRAPDDPKAQDRRAKLVELYVRSEQFMNKRDVRYRTAEAVAREYFAVEAKRPRTAPANPSRDAKVHRLLGQIMIGEAIIGDLKAIGGRSIAGGATETGALDELRAAQKLEPADVPGAELLARLLIDPKLAPNPKTGAVEARKVLDQLLQAENSARKPTAAARLARFRLLSALADGKPDALKLSRVELEEARKLAPKDPNVLIAAAEAALALKDFAAARKDIEAVPKQYRDALVVREFEGRLELSRFHPELAAESWRKALVSVGGLNAELTFRVAYIELQLNRVAEAEPLIAQLTRLLERKDAPEVQCLQALREIQLQRPRRALPTLEKLRLTLGSYSIELQTRISTVLGQAYEAVGDRAKAIEQYRAAAVLAPTAPGLRIQAARLALSAGDDRAAEQAAEELRRGLIDMPDEPILLLELLDVELRRQLRLPPDRRSWREFEQTEARAIAVAPNAPDLVRVQADYLAATGKLDQAVSQVGGAVKQDPKDPELWRVWAIGLSRQGKLDEAERVLERALATENAGDHASLRVQLARVLTLLGRGREARDKLVDRWQSLRPDERPVVWKAAADFARARGQTDEARHALVQWADLEPNNPQPALSLLETALAEDDREALKTATGLIAKIPTYQGVYSAIGRLQEILRDPEGSSSADKNGRDKRLADADKLVAEVQDKAPRLWVGHAQQGLLRELQNRPEEALRAYRKAREFGGGNSIVGRLVLLLTRLKRFDELAALRDAFAGNIAIDRLAAETSLNLGERDQAEALAGQVVSGDPDGLDARQWQARVLINLGESEKAEASLRDFIARHPGEPGPLLALLQFQVLLKRTDETIAATLKQIDNQVRVDHLEFFRAQCRRIAGDAKTAESLYRAALAKWPNDPAVALGAADFFFNVLKRDNEAEKIFRDRLERDPTDAVSARGLSLVLASRVDEPKAWSNAWNLIKPGAPAAGTAPIDRYVRAQILANEPERRAEAIKELETLLADLTIDRAEAVNGRDLLARLHHDAGDTDKALDVLRVAANTPGRTDSEAIARYLIALLDAKKTAEAAKQLDRLVELQPKSLRVDLLRGQVLQAQGKTADAVAVLKLAYQSRADGPNAEIAGREAVAALEKLERFDDAEAIAGDLAKRKPTLAWLIADIAVARGKPAEALAACRETLDAGATVPAAEVAHRLAKKAADAVPVDSATLQNAVAFIESIQAKAPADPQLLVLLGNARYFQKRFEDQVRLYRLALDKKPANELFLNGLAYILCEELNRPTEALEYINECIGHVGRSPNFLDTKGLILIRLKQNDAAIDVLKGALKLAPVNDSIVGTIQFHLALAQRQAGRLDAARAAVSLAKKAGIDTAVYSARERNEWEELSKEK